MVTAMQELIKHIQVNATRFSMMNAYNILIEIEPYLEKEKEQLLDFGLYVKKNGWVGCKIEDLYEDYYNQNK